MQIKIMRYHFTSTRIATIKKKQKITGVGEKLEPLCTIVGVANVEIKMENSMVVP